MAYHVVSHSLPEYELRLYKRGIKGKTGEGIEALSKHCIQCGLTGFWECRSGKGEDILW